MNKTQYFTQVKCDVWAFVGQSCAGVIVRGLDDPESLGGSANYYAGVNLQRSKIFNSLTDAQQYCLDKDNKEAI